MAHPFSSQYWHVNTHSEYIVHTPFWDWVYGEQRKEGATTRKPKSLPSFPLQSEWSYYTLWLASQWLMVTVSNLVPKHHGSEAAPQMPSFTVRFNCPEYCSAHSSSGWELGPYLSTMHISGHAGDSYSLLHISRLFNTVKTCLALPLLFKTNLI